MAHSNSPPTKQAKPKQWRLMVWDVPDRLGGLLSRLSFKPTKKNPAHWWRLFDPGRDKDVAERIRLELLAAGLRGSWQEMEEPKPKDRPYAARHAAQQRDKPLFDRGSYSARSGWGPHRGRTL